MGCLKLPYLNKLEVTKNYLKKELSSKNSSENGYRYLLFGSVQPGRSFNSGEYRYSFNGKENEGKDWTNTDGTHLDFGARMYDSRLGRFFKVDPKAIVAQNYSPYSFAGDNPIYYVDNEGEEKMAYIFLDFSGLQLSKVEQQQLITKLYEVFSRINESNDQLDIELEFKIINDVDNYNGGLDVSDVMVTLEDGNDLNNRLKEANSNNEPDGNGIYDKLDKGSIAQGYSPEEQNLPVAVYPSSIYKKDGSKFLNYIDMLAYSVAHEIIHRYQVKEYDEDGSMKRENHDSDGLMKSAGTLYEYILLNKEIKDLSDDAFKLPNYRIKNLNQRLGKNNGKSPKNNRSKNKKNRGGNKKQGKVIFNPRF